MRVVPLEHSTADPALARMSSPVRLARTRPPVLSGGLVLRTALSEWIARALAVPTTVIQAPAGYGKTTLSNRLFRDAIEERWRDGAKRLPFDVPVPDLERPRSG